MKDLLPGHSAEKISKVVLANSPNCDRCHQGRETAYDWGTDRDFITLGL